MARYAISDLHGHYELYKEVKKRLKVNDLLYVLGDCADRGPDGWKTLTAVIEDPQCILLVGNHELMLCDAMADWFEIREEVDTDEEADDEIYFAQSYRLLVMNGGEDTFWDWRKSDEMYMWFQRLQMLPLEYHIFDSRCGRPLILTHAGYTPYLKPDELEDLVWSRNHFFHEWKEKEEMGKAIVIHGHTPQEYLVEELVDYGSFHGKEYKETDFEILDMNDCNEWHVYDLTYADGHKICIDPGTVMSKKGLIINLDTLEQEVIRFPFKENYDRY